MIALTEKQVLREQERLINRKHLVVNAKAVKSWYKTIALQASLQESRKLRESSMEGRLQKGTFYYLSVAGRVCRELRRTLTSPRLHILSYSFYSSAKRPKISNENVYTGFIRVDRFPNRYLAQ